MDQNRLNTASEQSFRMNKWSSGVQEQGPNFAGKFHQNRKSINEYVVNSGVESNQRYQTEFSQITNVVDSGFRKMKYNQMETLNELRQEYQILRNLPIQEEYMHQHQNKKQEESSIHDSVQTSSKRSKKVKSRHTKDTQILSLEKKQLEMVIGNSMRKIEQLLNNQIQYKKIIHELQIQLQSRSNDDKIDSLNKTIKKNESQFSQKLENLRRQIDRYKQVNRQIQQKNSSLEAQLLVKEQELRKFKDDRRRYEQQVKNEKDRYSHIQIEYKKLKVQYQLLEKDKNSEINRIVKNMQEYKNENQLHTYKIRTLDDQIKSKDNIIQTLRHDIERLRNRPVEKIKPQVQKKSVNNDHISLFQGLVGHLKEQSTNQNKASLDLLSSILQNVESKRQPQVQPKANEDNGLLNQLYTIKQELSRLRRDKTEERTKVQYQDNTEYIVKINTLQNDLADNELENQRLKEECQNLKNSNEQANQDLDTLHKQCLQLRNKLGSAQNSNFFSNEQLKNSYRDKQLNYQQQIRRLHSKLDQALFMAQKWKKDKQHTIGLLNVEHGTNLKLLREQISKLEKDKAELISQLQRMKGFYEGKMRQKNQLLQKMSRQTNTMIQTHEKTLVSYRGNNERQINDLLRKLHEMADLQDRYIRLTTRAGDMEREIHELKHLIRRFKVLNDNVDHLWMVKQTEYGNISSILDSIKIA